MARRKPPAEPVIEPREFRSVEEIDRGIKKLERRLADLAELDIVDARQNRTGADDAVRSDITETIRDIFGSTSPEFKEHEHIQIWAGPMSWNMSEGRIRKAREEGKVYVTGILHGLIKRLGEKREDHEAEGGGRSPSSLFRDLALHPRIFAVAEQLFLDGHHWEAVFSASKALINLVKEKSGRDDLDGAQPVRTVFSRNDPVLAFNSLADQTDLDEQEGMMHLFEGAVLGIRNPGGHSFPEGPAERALEYLQLLSLLAYRTDETTRRKAG